MSRPARVLCVLLWLGLLVALAVTAAGCGAVTLEAADAGGDLSYQDAGVEAGDVDERYDRVLEHAVIPASSPAACAAAVAAAGYVAAGAAPCAACRGPAGEELGPRCRALVDCVAGDPHFADVVTTCNGGEGPPSYVRACVVALLGAAGCP